MPHQPTGLVLHVICRVDPSSRNDFIHIIREHIRQTEPKPGCNGYSFAVDINDANSFHIIEGWTDRTALDTHNASADFQQTLAELGRVSILSRETQMYTVSAHQRESPLDSH